MDKLVDHLFIFEGPGIIRDYPGNYTQFRILEKSKQNYTSLSSEITTQVEYEVKVAIPSSNTNSASLNQEASGVKKSIEKISYKEKLELEQLNKSVPLLESKKELLTEQLNNSSADYAAITDLSAQLAAITADLEAGEMRWLELSEKHS